MTDILAIGSHPDDIEFAIGGILARASAQGQSIVIADLTRGEMGTNGTPEERTREAQAAAEVIGAKRVQLDLPDCAVHDSDENRLKVIRLIRELKPKLLITHLWSGTGNHPDHIATGQLVRSAARYARFSKLLPELEIHRVDGVLHFPSFANDECDFLVDVSDHMEAWEQMIRCHKSQHKTHAYHDWCFKDAARWGIKLGVEFAQRLVKGNPIQVDNLMHISRGIGEI